MDRIISPSHPWTGFNMKDGKATSNFLSSCLEVNSFALFETLKQTFVIVPEAQEGILNNFESLNDTR